MFYFLWSLLNLILAVFFMVVCVKAIQLVRIQIGWFAAFIFVVGHLSFCQLNKEKTDNEETMRRKKETWNFISRDSIEPNSYKSITIDLQKNWTCAYSLSLDYGLYKNSTDYMAIDASVWQTGFASGIHREPALISVYQKASDSGFDYRVLGNIEWKLLGISLYTQQKEWTGIARFK